MSTLESVVLPLAESRALVEAGVVLETVMVWWHVPSCAPSKQYQVQSSLCDFYCSADIVCPAPTLGELLDAIRARVGDAEFHSYNVNTVIDIGTRTWELLGDCNDEVGVRGFYRTVERAQAPTDLLAAAALLMEVSR